MKLECGACVVRSYRRDDAEAIVANADDPLVARFMADRFPAPYSLEDARVWLSRAMDPDLEETHFAIECDREFAGGLGFERMPGERRFTAEYGYWLGHGWWGRGLMTAATRAFVEWAWRETDLQRIQAHVYAPNIASQRVLEKSGFTGEGIMRRYVFKAGKYFDAPLYAVVRPSG